MTPASEQLAAIRAKCMEANPEIVTALFVDEMEEAQRMREGRKYDSQHLYYNGVIDTLKEVRKIVGHPISLADVLLAIAAASGYDEKCYILNNGKLVWPDGEELWNLRTDDLTQQSPETIAFIHSLLCV